MAYAHVRELTVEHDGELHVEGLPVRAGETVEVVVIQRRKSPSEGEPYPLRGQPVKYDAPFDPAADPEDWEANR